MPSPFQRADAATQRAIISDLLGKDDELRDLATVLVKAALRESIDQLLRGDQSTRASIARAYAGVVTKALTESDTDDADQSLRAEMQQMFAEARGDMGLGDEATDDPPPPSPTPPPSPPARALVPKS